MIKQTRLLGFLLFVLCVTGMLWGCTATVPETKDPADRTPEVTDTTAAALPNEEDLKQYDISINQMRDLVADSLDGSDCFTWNQLPAILDQLEAHAADLLESEIITAYERNDACVYLEFACGIPCVCAPPTWGIDGSPGVYAFSPFASETDDDGTVRGNVPKELKELITSTFPDLSNGYSYSDSNVSVELLEGLRESKVFLWNGHGLYTDALGPVLVTGEAVQSGSLLQDALSLASKGKAMCENLLTEGGGRYAITSKFVTEEIRMNKGFVYLAACSSLKTDQLAQAFLNNGAEIVFGTTDEIMSSYDMDMMRTIVMAMCGELDDGVVHTAQEALEIARNIWGADDGYIRNQANMGDTPAAVVYLGKYGDSGDYTFCSGIRGNIRGAIPKGENGSALLPDSAVVRLYNGQGDLVASTVCDAAYNFYFHNLKPGDFWAEIVYNQKPLTVIENISVRDHRYTTAEIELTPVSGVVKDELGNFLSGVTVEALRDEKVVTKAQTGDSGQYSLMLGDNEYTLRYTKAGYRENMNNIAVKTWENQGDVYLLDDVTMQTGEVILRGAAQYSNTQWALYQDYHLVISGGAEGSSYTVGSEIWDGDLMEFREMIVSLELMPGAQTIADRTFSDCKALESISLPENLSGIEDKAFENCIRLKNVTIPQTTTFLDDGVFKGCAGLETVCFLGRVKTISPELFENCFNLKSVEGSEHIVYIGERAFSGCIQLERLRLSPYFQYFSTDSLKNCIGMKEIVYGGNEHIWQTVGLANNGELLSGLAITFEQTDDYFDLNDPDYSQLGSILHGDCGTAADWVLYENYCMVLAGSGMASGDRETFGGFTDQIRWLVIGQGIEGVGRKLFERAYNLMEVRIGDDVREIGESAFSVCDSLETVWLPAGLESIGNYAFSNCDSLTDVYYQGTKEQWDAIEIGFGNGSLDQATIHFGENAGGVTE